MKQTLYIQPDKVLLKSNLWWEGLVILIKNKPFYLFLLPFWGLYGKSYFINKIASMATFDIEYLPYNQDLLAWLKTQRQEGREITLLSSVVKLSVLDEIAGYCNCFTHTLIVDAKLESELIAQSIEEIKPVLKHSPFNIKIWLKAIRLHQYAKNLLLFIPLLLGHYFGQLNLIISCFLGFICFCLLASSVYLLNDLLDLPSDRRHSTKHKRAFASGNISIPVGLLLMCGFLISALLIALKLPLIFQLCLLIYYALTLLYSFKIKRIALLDVFTLSTLYTLRILAGLSLVGQGFSNWLVVFSMFFFTSLAFAKRYTELHGSTGQGINKLHGRGYSAENLPIISQFGIVSGYLSSLIFVLYLDSQKASQYYHHPKLLYLACPIILYWVSRIWLKASAGQLHEDPVIFALKDKVSYLLLLLMLAFIILATL